MAKGFKHGGGCGGNPLNFNVVGNPQPSNPKENTIWVDTDVPIGKWHFSATQPELSEGDVWFTTGTSSIVEFNALKKNGIQVYPGSAKQYVGGAWEKKDAFSWQNGEWKAWTWFLNPSELEYVKYEAANVKVTIAGDVINFTPSQDPLSNWIFAFKDPVDVTDQQFLRATMNLTAGVKSGYCGILICSKLPTTYTTTGIGIIAEHYADKLGTTELEIPLSGVTGTVYVIATGTYATGSVSGFHLM